MKTTFFHDTTFLINNGKYYTRGAVNREKFAEYINSFGEITAVVKGIPANEKNKNDIQEKNLIDNINVKTVKSNYSNSIKVVKKQMTKTDFAIIRMPSIIGISACREARKRKIPYMIEMVGCPKEALWYHGGIKYKLAIPFLYLINKYELKKCKHVNYVTKEFLEKRYPTKGKYQCCSDADIDKCNDSILKKRLEKIKNKDGKYKFGLIGALKTNYKGHETVIKAFSKLKGKFDFEIHFLGYGSNEKWKKMAENYGIKENIIFDGTLPHSEINKWFDDIDFYLIPSLTEGMPRALIEAMSRACPAIGTKVGGIPEILPDKMLIKKKSDKELAKLVLELIQNKKLQEKCAIENFEKAKEFEKEKLMIKRKEFYEEILREVSINEESFTSSK